ncbi:MAG: DMT family transporter [Vallitaleaceae bacterium]|nr:DMT family transporter [Vallitaleaceae bacterium]
MKMTQKKAVIYMMITALIWSTGGLLIKLVEWNPLAIASARSGIAVLILIPFVKFNRKLFNFHGIAGSIAYALTVLLFVSANKLTTSANAIFLQFTAPIWVIIFSVVFLRKKVRRSDTISIGMIFVGMAFFFAESMDSGKLFGNFIALLSGITFASMLMLMQHEGNESPLATIILGNTITFLIGLPFYFTSMPSSKSIIGLLLLGIFQIGISYLFYAKAVKHLTAIEGILIPVIEPLLNPVWVLLFFGEAPGKLALLGGVVVITTMVTRSIYQAKKPVLT